MKGEVMQITLDRSDLDLLIGLCDRAIQKGGKEGSAMNPAKLAKLCSVRYELIQSVKSTPPEPKRKSVPRGYSPALSAP